MEDPDVPKALKRWSIPGPADSTRWTPPIFASRETLVAKADQGMALWRDKLFLVMSRNATPAHRILPHSRQPAGGAGHAGRHLSAMC